MSNILKKYSKHILILVLLVASLLRVWNLSGIPLSLFGDELDVGYHAYSILKTGRDYTGNFMPLHFQSLAEWRTPLYLYSVVPTVALFGISPLGVRLPAAIFGVLSILGMYLFVKRLTKNESIAILSALILTFSPWHIQYSRAAFEVTMLLSFILFGLYFFFRSLEEGKYLWVSAALLVVTPLIYSTAKLFTPFVFLALFLLWRKEIFKISKKYLLWALIALFVLSLPTAYATLFSGGGQRFAYISIFTDPITEPEVGVARLRDARMRGEMGAGLQPTLTDRTIHNKFTFWAENLTDNYLKSFSTDFLFINGDPNIRHSIQKTGQFYKIEFVALILGVGFFFFGYKKKKERLFIGSMLLLSVFPSSITRIGGNHATRLIISLPFFVFLMSYGLVRSYEVLKTRYKYFIALIYIFLWAISFIFYQHNYRFHYPWDSERWWHTGWQEAVGYVKQNESSYDRVFITMADEPAWIFFAGWYEFSPSLWQKDFPIENKVEVEGFGEISYIDKFFFASPNAEGGIYALPNYLTKDDLYLASAKEVPGNLIMNPGQVPVGLKLLKAVAFPSGEPAFYLFTKAD